MFGHFTTLSMKGLMQIGLSDHHHLIYTMLKSMFEKAGHIMLTYLDWNKLLIDN